LREQADRVRDLSLVFRDAHAFGTRALQSGDYESFADTIAVERGLIDEQRDAIEKQRDLIEQQRAIMLGVSIPDKAKRKRRSSRRLRT